MAEWLFFVSKNTGHPPCVPDIQVKELDKRASGQAFEVLLGTPAPDGKGEFPLSPPKKKDVSLEEIQRKLDAAEERRKVKMDGFPLTNL